LHSQFVNYITIPVAIKKRNPVEEVVRVFRYFYLLYPLLKNKYNIIHTNGYLTDIIALPLSKILNIPHITTCHGFIDESKKLKIYNKMDKILLKFCDIIISVSKQIELDLITNGIKSRKIVTIPNAVTINNEYFINNSKDKDTKLKKTIGINKGEIIIGYHGRISKEKGLEYLFKACANLINSNFNIKLLIIGEGPDTSRLIKLSRKLGVKRKIIYVGFKKNIEKWIQLIDIYVLPSLTEGTPMALLEAMLMGKPIIATCVGGIPNIIKNEYNGLLVKPGDHDAISDAIIKLIENKRLIEKLKKISKSTIKKNYNINNWKLKYEQLYIDLTQ